jgi:hypothetical protein
MKKIQYCKLCGYIIPYTEERVCHYCSLAFANSPQLIAEIDEMIVDDILPKTICCLCKTKYDESKHGIIPPFLNVLHNTFYCGCRSADGAFAENRVDIMLEELNKLVGERK